MRVTIYVSTLCRFLNYTVEVPVSIDLLCNCDHLLRITTCLSCQQAARNELQTMCCFFWHEHVFEELLVSPLPWSPCFAGTGTLHCLLSLQVLLARKSWLLELTVHFTGLHCTALLPWLFSPCFPYLLSPCLSVNLLADLILNSPHPSRSVLSVNSNSAASTGFPCIL